MAYSINTEPLLNEDLDSESESDIDIGTDDLKVIYPQREPFLKNTIPYDRYNLAYIVFILLGINTLIPWNFFITADDYWRYKFREINPNESHSENFSRIMNLEKRTDLQASFTSYISISSAIPSTIFSIINTFISKRIPLSTRMIGSQCIILVVFILTTSFARVNTDSFQNAFLIITLTSVGIVNAASAIFGGSLLGIVGRFSSKYITGMSIGQALGGIFTAMTEILSLWIGASPVISGLLYFIIGDIVLLLSLIAYLLIEREVFFKHHIIIKTQDPNEPDFPINDEITFSGEHVSYTRIFKRTWKFGLSIFLVFFITMIVYPSVTVLIESQGKGHGHAWNDVYFVPVVTYLIFSCGDYVGRILAGVFMWPKKNSTLLVVLSLLRILFVPAFLFCNAQPRHHLPVYIHDDVYYIIITILFAVSNGYLCNIVFMFAPAVVESNEKEIASAMIGAFLGIGVSVGSSLSLVMIKIL